jgi:ribosomal protein L24E
LEKEQFALQIVVRYARIYSQKENLLQSKNSFGNLPFLKKKGLGIMFINEKQKIFLMANIVQEKKLFSNRKNRILLVQKKI